MKGSDMEADQRVADDLEGYRQALTRYAMTLVREPNEAEDLVQRAFERALGTAVPAPPGARRLAWLRVVLRNLTIDDGRRAARHQRAVGPEVGQVSLAPERSLGTRPDLRVALLQALRRLPPEMSQAILLVVVEGFTYAEVSELQGVAVGTVKSRVARARIALARVLSGEGDATPEGRR